jgi:hypothetical protein
MPIAPYVPGYPPDGSSLGQTKSTIRNNLDGTFETLAVDHINNNGQPGAKPAGYHTIIHEVPQTSVSTVNGYNQVFSGVPGTLVVNSVITPAVPSNGDQQLYSLSGAGALAQLTGFSAANTGYAWVGGVLLQWGRDTSSGTGNDVNFAIPFPKACFVVVATVYNSGSNVRQVCETTTPTQTKFTAIGTNITNDIMYIAIGN